MQQKESYDVLRLIEHGQICYISSENVQGRTLARYLKYHPVMEKKEMFLLLKAIAEQLELIHRCRGNPCYQYVNPYSIILAEDGRVYFLDMKAETNMKQVVFMQRRDMREYFLLRKRIIIKMPVKSWTYMDWERHFNIFSLRQKQNRI